MNQCSFALLQQAAVWGCGRAAWACCAAPARQACPPMSSPSTGRQSSCAPHCSSQLLARTPVPATTLNSLQVAGSCQSDSSCSMQAGACCALVQQRDQPRILLSTSGDTMPPQRQVLSIACSSDVWPVPPGCSISTASTMISAAFARSKGTGGQGACAGHGGHRPWCRGCSGGSRRGPGPRQRPRVRRRRNQHRQHRQVGRPVTMPPLHAAGLLNVPELGALELGALE